MPTCESTTLSAAETSAELPLRENFAEFFGDKLPWPSPGKAQAVILNKLPDVRERSQRQKMVGPSDGTDAAAAFPLGHYVLFFDEARH